MKFRYILGSNDKPHTEQSYKDYRKSKADKKFIDDIYNMPLHSRQHEFEEMDIIDIDYEEVKDKELPEKF